MIKIFCLRWSARNCLGKQNTCFVCLSKLYDACLFSNKRSFFFISTYLHDRRIIMWFTARKFSVRNCGRFLSAVFPAWTTENRMNLAIWASMDIDFLIRKEISKSTLINLSIKLILLGIQAKQKTHAI